MNEEQAQADSGQYKKVASLVREWLEIHKGEKFNLDTICRQLNILERDNRKFVAIELSRKVHQGKLEKVSNIYIYIDNTIKYIDWINVNEEAVVNIKWPYGMDDESHFGFDGHIVICSGEVIVISGVSNMGKTAFCLNLVWNNMDGDLPVTLMGNEYTPIKFKRRVKRMTWATPYKEDGTPKFELIERREDWKHAIRPDNLNIIDWINLGDNFYQIGTVIDGIQSKLKSGVAVVVLQQAPGKQLGVGGHFGMDLSSVYLSIDYQRLTVMKAKEWYEHNPNHEMYGFEIVDGGNKFHHIRKVKNCPKCYGKSAGNYKCETCFGKGHIDSTE